MNLHRAELIQKEDTTAELESELRDANATIRVLNAKVSYLTAERVRVLRTVETIKTFSQEIIDDITDFKGV